MTSGLARGAPAVRPDGAPALVRAQLTTSVTTTEAEAEALAPEWRELGSVAGAGPFTGPEYGLSWWRHRGRGRLHIVTVRCTGQLVALAPLHVRPLAGLSAVRWLGHGLGTVGQVLVRPGYSAAASAVWQHLAGLPRVLLDLLEYRDDGGGLAELRRSEALTVSAGLRDVCPVIELDGLDSAETLLSRLNRRHRLRRSMARAERELQLQGAVFETETATDLDGWRRLLPAVEAVYDAAEAAQPRLHLLRPPWRDFLVEFLESMVGRGEATVFLARVGGRPAGFEVTIDSTGTRAHWLSRFDPAFGPTSPGHLLMRSIVDAAIARGLERCDLLIGDGPHKLPWATASYDTLTVHAAPRALPMRCAALSSALAARDVAHGIRTRLDGLRP